MIKYTDTQIGFREFPGEITLLINISGCPNKCVGCHSPELRKDIGTELTNEVLDKLIRENRGITCVGFMGGDGREEELNKLARHIVFNSFLHVGWYSGQNEINPKIREILFNYIKIGPYIAEKGPLDKETTNQRMYEISHDGGVASIKDITNKFWRDVETI